jgi:beta-glucosidase
LEQSSLIRTEKGFSFRDLNKNGKLDVYEDPRQPIDARIDDLLKQMTLEEKAGLLFINGAVVNEDGSIEDKPDTPGFARAAITQITHQQLLGASYQTEL